MKPKKPPKASDIFRQTNYDFGEKVSFDEAYPGIEDIRVEVIEYGHGAKGGAASYYTRKNTPGEFVNCSNLNCYGGGFSLGQILREMVGKKQKNFETTKTCKGYEGSPKGRKKYRDCFNSFEIKVSIKYKTDTDPPE